jgi:quinoprotein glucose dehydrogenase
MLCLAFSLLADVGLLHSQAEDKPYAPHIEAASPAGEQAIKSFKIPTGWTPKLFAAEPMLANPVAFTVDHQGRVFVAETFRQNAGTGVEDNRGHSEWLDDDLRAQTVQDRINYILKHHPEAAETYTKEHDRIRRILDSNADGVADSDTVLADGFNHLEDGTGAGVLSVNGDIYYTCIPKLWKITDPDNDGVANEKIVLSDGYGVRFAFRGHDMHGLIRGPDGRIYYSIGDRGIHVKTQEGKLLHYPDNGLVMRCELDGSNLEVYAHGLRNPQELAFDELGNLFSGDNNSDGGDQARWVYITPGSDAGWRMYYQYLSDRGPWNRERMWWPLKDDAKTYELQPAFIVPPVENFCNGPSGLTYDPGVGLPPEFQKHFFICDFRGGASNSGIRSFASKPKGSGYELIDPKEFLWRILATDVDFGPDGKLYVSDWVNGWNGEGKGRIYTLTPPTSPDQKLVLDAQNLLAGGIDKLDTVGLFGLFDHPDRRVRLEAQYKLATKEHLPQLEETITSGKTFNQKLHAIWGTAQAHRMAKTAPVALIAGLKDADLEIQTQAAKLLAEQPVKTAEADLLHVFKTGSPRGQSYAAMALGKIGSQAAAIPILSLIAKTGQSDPWLRHALITAINDIAGDDLTALTGLKTHPSEAVRVAGVVALRRRGAPEVAEFLTDDSLVVVTEAARAIHDVPITAAIDKLAAVELPLNNVKQDDALLRRVISANFRVGDQTCLYRLIDWSLETKLPVHLRNLCVNLLLDVRKGLEFDLVTNQWLPIPARDNVDLKPSLIPVLPELFKKLDSSTEKIITLIEAYNVTEAAPYLNDILSEKKNDEKIRAKSLEVLSLLNKFDTSKDLETYLNDPQEGVRVVAIGIAVQKNPTLAIKSIESRLKVGGMTEKQASVRFLKDMQQEPAAQKLLQTLLGELITGTAPHVIQLEILETAQAFQNPEIQQLVKNYESQLSPEDPVAKYQVCLEGGDPSSGKDIFFNNSTASCRRCHIINGEGGGVGPELSEIGKSKPRPYLLEAIVAPNKSIAKGFETITVVTDDGKSISGILKEETDKHLTITLAMGGNTTIDKEAIIDRAPGQSGMPADLMAKLSLSQVRDLVAYLEALKKKGADTIKGH